MSTSALNPSGTQISKSGTELTDLISVAVAKEPIYLILVEKNLQRLRVLEYDNGLKVVADYPSATGENFGIKEISGDSKTPEGIYFITQIFRDDEITIFGDKAFHLDYPNFFDQEAGRNGNGIYIHGTNKELELNSTNGCITLANSDLDDLENYLNQVVTPVIIVPELKTVNKIMTRHLTENNFNLAKSLLLVEEINSENVEYNYLYVINFGEQTVAVSDFIYRPFKRTIMRGASKAYLEYHSDKGWTTRKRIWRVSPLQIYPEAPVKIAAHPLTTGEVQLAEQTPEEAAAMVAALRSPKNPSQNSALQEKRNPGSQSTVNAPPEVSKKSKVVKKAPPIKDIQQIKPAPPAVTSVPPSPQVTVVKRIEQQQKIMVSPAAIPKDKLEVIEFIESWRQAWVSQEIEPYIAFYDASFKNGDKDLTAWKEHKTNLNKTYKFINVQ